MMRQIQRTLLVAFVLLLSGSALAEANWPPAVGMPYPDLKLLNQDGKLTSLSSFKGKILLVEPIGMTCPACNAFADTTGVGGCGGNPQQGDLPSYKKLAQDYGRVQLPRPDVVVVHLLLYNQQMQPPTLKDAKAWAQHFGMSTFDNEYVLVGKKSQQVYDLIPGFHLIDKNFMLVSDGTGHQSKNDLYKDLFPKLGQLVGK